MSKETKPKAHQKKNVKTVNFPHLLSKHDRSRSSFCVKNVEELQVSCIEAHYIC